MSKVRVQISGPSDYENEMTKNKLNHLLHKLPTSDFKL